MPVTRIEREEMPCILRRSSIKGKSDESCTTSCFPTSWHSEARNLTNICAINAKSAAPLHHEAANTTTIMEPSAAPNVRHFSDVAKDVGIVWVWISQTFPAFPEPTTASSTMSMRRSARNADLSNAWKLVSFHDTFLVDVIVALNVIVSLFSTCQTECVQKTLKVCVKSMIWNPHLKFPFIMNF